MVERIFSYWDRSVLNITPCNFRAKDKMEIETNYPFVGLLSNPEKKRFYRRLCKVLRLFNLIQKGDVNLSRRDRILIAVPAVILTFGFKYLHWGRFRHLFIFPKAYKNRITGKYHYGETNPMGVIVLSLKRVNEGIDDPDDALHLIYHEYAHALVVSRQSGNHAEDRRFMRAYDSLVKVYMNSPSVQESTLIRPYGFVNEMEFFAVLVEVLMERAADLKEHHLNLYNALLETLKLGKWEDAILKQSTWFR